MNLRENTLAILHYEKYDHFPLVHFGYWAETLQKWASEGHLSEELARSYYDGGPADFEIAHKLGFDFNWGTCYGCGNGLFPPFEPKVLEVSPEGYRKIRGADGVVTLTKIGIVSIPTEIDHTLKDRASYEKYYKPKLQYDEKRINFEALSKLTDNSKRETPLCLHCGSLFGDIRNWLGLENSAYLYADDEELFDEIINDVADLCYRLVKRTLETGAKFDFAHFWEDICFKNGPLVIPSVFEEKVGPLYKRITEELKKHGIDIVSLDCDGMIDSLVPIWLKNGVNTMFPIEVGTWNASIKPWREKYGRELRGVGGMDKRVFAADYAAVDREVERLRPLVALGGFIPCPDHRIPPDAKWENVEYYCEKMNETFNG